MNNQQFAKYLIKNFGDEFQYTAPEMYSYKMKKFGYLDIAIHEAAFFLWKYSDSLIKRANGTIVDNWINRETFEPILDEIIFLLNTIERNEIQDKILEIFSSL